jgi:hypothetical protein
MPEVGMYIFKARFYSPTLGMFLQPDPLEYIDSMSLYQYVANDPINKWDPMGMSISWCGYVYTGPKPDPDPNRITITAPGNFTCIDVGSDVQPYDDFLKGQWPNGFNFGTLDERFFRVNKGKLQLIKPASKTVCPGADPGSEVDAYTPPAGLLDEGGGFGHDHPFGPVDLPFDPGLGPDDGVPPRIAPGGYAYMASPTGLYRVNYSSSGGFSFSVPPLEETPRLQSGWGFSRRLGR